MSSSFSDFTVLSNIHIHAFLQLVPFFNLVYIDVHQQFSYMSI